MVYYRVTTNLEKLEKSGNSKVVREKSGRTGKKTNDSINIKHFCTILSLFHIFSLKCFFSLTTHVCHLAAVSVAATIRYVINFECTGCLACFYM